VATGFNRNNGVLMGLATGLLMTFARTPEQGAETLVWLATAPDDGFVNGAYYVDKEPRRPSPEAEDMQTAQRLWEVSEIQCRERAAAEKAER
jgi:hypothetical protein